MLTSSDTPRRNAVRSLVASGLALVGLSQALNTSYAKKKKRKKHNNPPAAPAAPAVRDVNLVAGTHAPLTEGAIGGVFFATSKCPSGTIAITRLLLVNQQTPDPPQAGDYCFVSEDSPEGDEWLAVVNCRGNATANNSFVTASCLNIVKS